MIGYTVTTDGTAASREFWYAPGVGVCPRCNGGGEYSYNPTDGTRCFGCHGTGHANVRRKLHFAPGVTDERKAEIRKSEASRKERNRMRAAERRAEKKQAEWDANVDALLTAHPELTDAVAQAKAWRTMSEDDPNGFRTLPRGTIIALDLLGKIELFGSLSEGQQNLLTNVTTEVRSTLAERSARKEAELRSAKPCPEGRVEITGTVGKVVEREGRFGWEHKMLVIGDGWKVWGSVPSALARENVERGWSVRFTATVERSQDDENFGFYKRPAKATIVDRGES